MHKTNGGHNNNNEDGHNIMIDDLAIMMAFF